MIIRRADKNDTVPVLRLLSQVLGIHAAIRPDIFVPGTTKYSAKELEDIFNDEKTPVYVAQSGTDGVIGYAFCVIKDSPDREFFVPRREMYIDDLCVDASFRGKHVGSVLFGHVVSEAERLGCRSITLNVWEGNDSAKLFYENLGMKPMSYHMEYNLQSDRKEMTQ